MAQQFNNDTIVISLLQGTRPLENHGIPEAHRRCAKSEAVSDNAIQLQGSFHLPRVSWGVGMMNIGDNQASNTNVPRRLNKSLEQIAYASAHFSR